jgi:hypothetical protein
MAKSFVGRAVILRGKWHCGLPVIWHTPSARLDSSDHQGFTNRLDNGGRDFLGLKDWRDRQSAWNKTPVFAG